MLQRGLALTSLALLSGCGLLPPPAQQSAGFHRIGILAFDSAENAAATTAPITEALSDVGYVEGRNLAVERRFAKTETQLPSLAAELVRLEVDLIVPLGTAAARAARVATGTIPIVINSSDPVGAGLVNSLALPGGNVTGTTTDAPDLTGMKLELLREIVPRASRVGMLTNPDNPTHAPQELELEAAAGALSVRLQPLEVRAPADLDVAFQAATDGRAEALMILSDGLVLIPQRARIARLAIEHRLPTMAGDRQGVEAGGLISYGVNLADQHRARAAYVDKILKGARPDGLPVEGPTKFDLVVNLGTEHAIGRNIPHSVLAHATQIIR